jgi:hypothetical protein
MIAGSHGPQGQGPPFFSALHCCSLFFVKATNSQNANFLLKNTEIMWFLRYSIAIIRKAFEKNPQFSIHTVQVGG